VAIQLAATTHVDGTARLQTLERGMAPRMHALLEAYGRRSGIPVLLNTSFNVAGEPIVNRALEGYSTFRRCGMDALVAGRRWSRSSRVRRSRGRSGRDQEARRHAAPVDHARQRRRIDRGSRARHVAADSGRRWLLPLAVFLCLFGLLLILATTVEALAPFIYAIF